MGDHAEDEIYKEMYGHYPWEEPFSPHGVRSLYNGDGTPRKSKGIGFRNWRGIRLYLGTDKVVPKGVKREIIVRYCIESLEMDPKTIGATSNEILATEIQKNFTRFGEWWKSAKSDYLKKNE